MRTDASSALSHGLALVLILLAPWGCAPGGLGLHTPLKNAPDQPPGEKTLYQRLGGEPAISAIVDDWIDRALEDRNVNFIRAGQPHTWPANPDSVARVKAYFSQYVGMLTGGPQIYSGRDLLTTHTGMKISEGEWLSFLADCKRTLDSMGFNANDKKELLQLLAGTHDAIVDK